MSKSCGVMKLQYEVKLEVVQCSCGFYLGIDDHWLNSDDGEDFEMKCPKCENIIDVFELTR